MPIDLKADTKREFQLVLCDKTISEFNTAVNVLLYDGWTIMDEGVVVLDLKPVIYMIFSKRSV